jgi:hypothetical protein
MTYASSTSDPANASACGSSPKRLIAIVQPDKSISVAMTGLNPPALAPLSFLTTFRARRAALKCADLETEALLVELVAWETAIHQRVAYPGGESG